MLNMLGKNSADDNLKYFACFSKKIGFDISCKLSPQETICMKYQSLFSGKIIISLSSAVFVQRVVKVCVDSKKKH